MKITYSTKEVWGAVLVAVLALVILIVSAWIFTVTYRFDILVYGLGLALVLLLGLAYYLAGKAFVQVVEVK